MTNPKAESQYHSEVSAGGPAYHLSPVDDWSLGVWLECDLRAAQDRLRGRAGGLRLLRAAEGHQRRRLVTTE